MCAGIVFKYMILTVVKLVIHLNVIQAMYLQYEIELILTLTVLGEFKCLHNIPTFYIDSS